jgi:alanyl-tRNA synthetase
MSSPEVRAHSAIHVLKGAVTRVLGPRRFVFGENGVLKFKSQGPLTSQELGRIGAAANRKIAEDAEVLEFEMARQEAEGHFGTAIYDLSPEPGPGELLRIVRIQDWEASSCPQAHVESTGSIGAIRIEGATFDDAAREAVIRFRIL